ncbi:lysylphosphatidylglycerol synthase domain-containing protein [Demequina sp. SYSU T00192]|uniref:Lysylphosphatidylglycerol synthase domain-containing protein n=1 Tax=Demequina litoralis TaxID=3051660 RepID=A0ABT8GAR5_9MICO|nr:lysylphosphatidylglycerol synthase domain-containing protein [Demequina sp. SYSU T00192]MDN4476064.1 lysylphosphatidylglycerol synthase domain-containing protein [Demequina sp. SYSU T00192]
MRTALRWGFLAVAAGLLGWAVVSNWDQVSTALRDLTWGAIAGSLVACMIALGVNAMSWRAVMRAIGLDTTVAEAMRVFLLSQVGKYVPGSVWPVLAQAEFARDHGVSRPRAMTGSIVAMVVGVVTSAVVGAVGLVLAVPDALAAYWWVLAVAAALAVVLVPAVLKRVVALAFRVTRRAEEPAHIGGRALLASAAWSTLMWVVLGVHAWLLLRELAPGAGLAVVTGAFAFAWLVGFLVVVAPAGAGAREWALVLALAPVATPAQALSLALVSRFLMTAADVAGLGIGIAIGARRPDAARPRRGSAPPPG